MAIEKKTKEQLSAYYVERLKKWRECGDKEIAHIEADDLLCAILCELGYFDVVSEYKKIDKWYS